MADIADDLLLEVLKACAQSAPAPLYAAEFAAYSGLERSMLDQALDFLRLRGLVRLTDWVRGKGQGYAITTEGELILENPKLLRRAQVVAAPDLRRPPELAESVWARGEAVRDTLLNPVRPVVTVVLLASNIAVFLMGTMESGDLVPAKVLDGQWWRLLSYAFLHAGIVHLFMNMYALYSLGPMMESLWGSVRFAAIYLFSALAGGCAVMLTARSAVGASGAVCGLITSLGVWVYLNRQSLPPNLVSSWMRNVLTNIVLVAAISFVVPRVSWEGHLGGALGGALISVPLNYQRFGGRGQKIIGLLIAVLLPIVPLGIVYYHHRDTITARRENSQVQANLYPAFRDVETKAAAVYNEHVVPLLNVSMKKKFDKARIDEARTASTDVQQQLLEAIALFDKAGPFHAHEVEEKVTAGRNYLEQWAKYFSLFAKTFEQPPPLTRAQLRALTEQRDELIGAERTLRRSKFLPEEHRRN